MANNRMALFHSSGLSIVLAKRMGAGWYHGRLHKEDLADELNAFFDRVEALDNFFETQDKFVLALENNADNKALPEYNFNGEERILQTPDHFGSYRAVPCACGSSACQHWHVTNVAAVQGVRFTREQAEAVAGLLTAMAARDAGA